VRPSDLIELVGGPLDGRLIPRGTCAACGAICGAAHNASYVHEQLRDGFYRLEAGASAAVYVDLRLAGLLPPERPL
jgi:hypothetical protein